MERICSDPNLERSFRQNGLAYMEQYMNQHIVKKWISVIEACDKEEKGEEEVLHREEAALSHSHYIFIYGAGYVGRMIYLRLSKRIKIDCFAVTSRKPGETDFLGVPIREISELRYPPNETVAIVGVGGKYEDEVVRTLQEYGFNNFSFPYIEPMSGEYYSTCKELDIKSELLDWYRLHTGKDIDLEHPQSYNEKIQWLKLYDSQPQKTKLSDKFAVREYVSEKIGETCLIPLLGVWDSFSEIDFSLLPNQFVLKCTHGSGTNLVVTDKTKLDYAETKRKFDRWMEMDYSLMSGFEMHYAGIMPRIIAEELLETEGGEDLRDYKVFVFNGHTKLIQVDLDRNHTHRRNLYTPEWEYVPCSIKYPTAPEVIIDKPACLEEMIRAAETLAEGFIHVRVDFYICGSQLFFGEMTFTHGSGIEPFVPEEYGLTMGEWMEIPKGE